MAKIEYYNVVLDGIDKCGKDTILKYVFLLSEKQYICNARGLMSLIAYSKIFDRGFEYDLTKEKNGPSVHFLLQVDKEDWLLRCKSTGEPLVDYDTHSRAFEEACDDLCSAGIIARRINTSQSSPYDVAKRIVKFMKYVNGCYDEITC